MFRDKYMSASLHMYQHILIVKKNEVPGHMPFDSQVLVMCAANNRIKLKKTVKSLHTGKLIYLCKQRVSLLLCETILQL